MTDFFDCNCVIGRRAVYQEYTAFGKDDILAEMRRMGIGSALATSSWSLDYSAAAGNKRILEETEGEAKLHPLWSALPSGGHDFPDPRELLADMKSRGVRAVRLSPAEEHHCFSLGELVAGPLLAALEKRAVPIFLDYAPKLFDQVAAMMMSHPKLDVVLMNTGYRINRHVFPLMRAYPGVRIELSGFKQYLGVETVVREFGAERLVFGTGMPLFSAGAAVAMVSHAKIADREKRLIARGNLERLLEGALL